MIVSAAPAKLRPTAKEYRQQWAEKLRANTRPRGEASDDDQSDPALCWIANFLTSLPREGPLRTVIRKFVNTKAVYIVSSTLHIHTLHLRKKEEVNSILLATHFGIVDTVHIHNFHIYHYIISERVHVRIAQSHWGAVQSILSYISKRLEVGSESKRRGPIKITFDEFLRPAVTAWKNGVPYAQIVCDLPLSETSCITSSIFIPSRHPSLSCFTRGYVSDSDCEVEIENDDYDDREDYEILLFLAYPSVPYVQP